MKTKFPICLCCNKPCDFKTPVRVTLFDTRKATVHEACHEASQR